MQLTKMPLHQDKEARRLSSNLFYSANLSICKSNFDSMRMRTGIC